MPKGIFIGIGGTGVTTVARLKALLFKRAYNSDINAMNADCVFIFYDTDDGAIKGAINNVELQRMMGINQVINTNTEWVDASSTAPANMYNVASTAGPSDANSQRFLEWAIDPNVQGHFAMPNKQLSQGAGAQRMAGRTGVYSKYNDLERRILTGIEKMQQIAGQGDDQIRAEHPQIWVFSSSNGGTSSSALLDALYLADRLYRANASPVDPYLRLVLYMPKIFIDKNKENAKTYGRNAYATLWELNEFRVDAVLRNDGKRFGAFAVRPDKTDWRGLSKWPVCSYVMAVDSESQVGSVAVEQMYQNTAELCYFLHSGAVGQSMLSQLDNDIDPNSVLAQTYREPTDDPYKWAQFVLGTGYKAITKADDFLKDYVRTRLRYDLYGYGLIGFPMDKILPSPEDRKKAATDFANEYILKLLIDINRFDRSASDSLFKRYASQFEQVAIPLENEIPTKDDWPILGTNFVNECTLLEQRIQSTFDDPSKNHSKNWYLEEIANKVMEGVDKNIVDHGLSYTYTLLTMVDDEYCEQYVMSKLPEKSTLNEISTEIENIIATTRPKKGIADLVSKLKEYQKECVRELALKHIRDILATITKEKVGLLEYIRKGDQSHKGVLGLIETISSALSTYKKNYQELASAFKKTEMEICSDYFPKIHTFVTSGDAWVQNHLFEQLYSSIVPLNTAEGSIAFESTNYGCPPIRRVEDKGLSPILGQIKAKVPNKTFLFAELAMSNPMTTFAPLFSVFAQKTNEFIEDSLMSSNQVKTWLDKPLDVIFDEDFTTGGVLDTTKRSTYITHFTSTIPVFYPYASGVTPEITHRWIYAGASQKFAQILGFQAADNTQQYIEDNSMGNRFIVCKIEVGHNFYDYKFFRTVKNYYEADRRTIENQGTGCHIHKDFVYRDIVSASDNLKQKKFNDFVSLCWYDSFFEFLNDQQNKSHIKAFFGESMGMIPGIPGLQMPGMPMQPQGMQMPGMPAQPQGMQMPGMPAQPQGMQMPGMPMQPQGMQMPGMPAQPQGMQMPGMPAQPQGMQMPGMPMQPQGMQMPGMPAQPQGMQMPPVSSVQNLNIENGYKPIVSIDCLGQITIHFEKIVFSNNHLGFERNQVKDLTISATSLTEIWLNIIQFEEITYSTDYIALIGKVFAEQSPSMKDEIKKLFYGASYMYNNNGSFYGEVWNRFVKKIQPLANCYQNLQTDANVWYQMIGSVYNLLSKNIFY